jgi:hypothetical protein
LAAENVISIKNNTRTELYLHRLIKRIPTNNQIIHINLQRYNKLQQNAYLIKFIRRFLSMCVTRRRFVLLYTYKPYFHVKISLTVKGLTDLQSEISNAQT